MIILTSDCLRAEIAEPGEHPNDTVRFDRAGFISEVVLNNERHFCSNENKNNRHPSTGGRGLCCEYTMDVSLEAKVGERYPKLGVGMILKETDEPYHFSKKYDVRHYPVKVNVQKNKAGFITEPVLCMGYALSQKKVITVEGNTITVETEIENAGEKPISTREYCHNFLNIDGYAVTEDYYINMPALRKFDGETLINKYENSWSNLVGKGSGFTFVGSENMTILADVDLTGAKKEIPFRWTLGNTAGKCRIEAEDYYEPSAVVLWTTDHNISPELMNEFTLMPGEKKNWKRKMSFIDELA